MRRVVMAIVAVFCLSLAACASVSPAEQALDALCAERTWIETVDALRESGGSLVPVQRRVCETLESFDEVAACECVLAPETRETATENPDKSITFGRETRLRFAVLITLKPREAVNPNRLAWDKERAWSEVAALLTDGGLKDFTLDVPLQSGLTWIVTGNGPVEGMGGKQ